MSVLTTTAVITILLFLSVAGIPDTAGITAFMSFFSSGYPMYSAQTAAPERMYVLPSGCPFGIKVRSDGVMVVGVNNGSPAQKCGIRKGDVITSVNGTEVTTNEELSAAIQLSSPASLCVRRGDSLLYLSATPDIDDGILRIGAWVRDSAAGIGTLTFVSPETGDFAGLGHSVSDVTTGDAVPLGKGEITAADIYDVIKGKSGETGELCGALIGQDSIGSLTANTDVGVFGQMNVPPTCGEPVPVAFRHEVECGEAVILSTISGTQPQEYSIEIERINLCDLNGSKGMVISVTDKRLLEQTGGIVRGMSGSPILQNGRLVGAVTHVLVNDPTKGYAVFAETMLSEMSDISS